MSKNFNLDAYKKSIKVADTPLKPDAFVVLDECLHGVLGLPGIPLGHITQIYGMSDTGKTSLMFHAAAKAQEQGIMPVVIVTEGKVDWERAAAMGFDKDKAIVQENLPFLEDVFEFIDKVASDVSMGELPYNTIIFFDSVGNTLSREEVEIKKDGTWEKKSTMMKAAKVISERMRVMAKKINETRKISYPNAVGLVILNQAYTQPAAYPGASPSLVPYGGNAIWFRSSLVIRTSRRSKLAAIVDGQKMGFGIVSKIQVDKNHISNTANAGEFVITADAIIPDEPGAIKDYKDSHKETWGNMEALDEIKED